MPVMNLHGYVSDGGAIICGSPGMECHVITPILSGDLTTNHDETLAELTVAYNALVEPYLAPRPDGRQLRLFTTPEGDSVFVWAYCHGANVTKDELAAKHGPPATDSNQIRAALGLR